MTALAAAALAALAAWTYDDQIGFLEPFDRVVRDTGFIPAYAIALMLALACSKGGRAWLMERIPVSSAQALGLFRMAFAASLAMAVPAMVPPASQPLCLALLALYGAGLAARVTFILFVVIVTRAQLANASDHSIALPLKTLWVMMLVPWGAGLSIDAALRSVLHRPPPPARSRAYGLAFWIPVLMLGLAYAAAAFAKMDEVGLRWISGGAVKYLFLADAHNAPLNWGRYIARSDLLSVLFSGLAVAGESLIIVAAIRFTTPIVVSAGLVAAGLHLGFYLFQGVWWSAWWALLPAFLPWEPIASALHLTPDSRDTGDSSFGRFSPVVAVALLATVIQQPVASLFRATYSFVISDFPMYSNVYFSTRAELAAVQESQFQPPPMIRFTAADTGERLDANIETVDRNSALVEIARKVAHGMALNDADAAAVKELSARYVAGFGRDAPHVDILADTWKFDWSVADFVPRQQWKSIAVVSLDEGIIEVRKP